jgi:Flp pilus assembly protein TadG
MIRGWLHDRRGSAAAEFALALPMMLALMFGGFEAGHFFWTEHKLVKAVRDGARFASRLPVEDLCDGATVVMTSATEDLIQNVTATGVLTDGRSKVPGWDPNDVNVTVGCQDFVATGIYTGLGEAAPMVSVSTGGVGYPSLFGQLGFIDSTIQMNARASAAVVGI